MPPRLTSPPIAPPPSAEWVEGQEGVRLFVSVTLPAASPVAVVVFVLGPEITTRPPYPRLQAALTAAGFATCSLHPRGTGYSDGLRGDLADYSLFLADQHLGLATAVRRFGPLPTFLFGHSVGALMALEVAARAEGPLAGVVLVNPPVRLRATAGMGPRWFDYLRYAVDLLIRPTALTVDLNARPEAVAFPADRDDAVAMQRDPLAVRYFSLRYLLAQRRVMRRGLANAAFLTAPLLMVQGAHDELIDPRGIDELLAAAKTDDRASYLAREGGHGASAVETSVGSVVDWLVARCGRFRTPGGSEPG